MCYPLACFLLTDSSTAFDCLSHNLKIVKLNAYGFGNKTARFVYDYLTSYKRRTKISDNQGSILGRYYSTLACEICFL